jgi:hypothetical protein
MDIKEFAPHMRPAGSLDNPSAGEQLVKPGPRVRPLAGPRTGATVGVDDAAKLLQMRLRTLALAVGRIEEQGRGRPRAGKRPLVTNVGPQPAGLGLTGTRRQDRHRCVVDMQRVAGEDVGSEGVDERLQRRGCGADPAGQGRGLQAHPGAGEDLGLAIERQVVVVLRYHDMGEQPRPGAPARNRVVRCRRRNHRVAGPARQRRANMPDHLEPAGHVIEGLGHLVADLAQRPAATGTSAWCGMPQILSGQVFRQWAPRRLLCLGCDRDGRGDRRRCCREPLRLVGFQGLERQLERLGVARQLLRRAAKLGPPVTRQLEFQPGDLGLGSQRILRHRGDDAL